MPLTPAQKDFALRESGYDPAQYDIDDDWYVTPKRATQPAVSDNGMPQPIASAGPRAQTPGITALREGIHAAPAAAGAGLGAAIGTALGVGLAPATGGLSLAIPAVMGLGGALAGGIGVSSLQDKIEQNVVPDYVAQREANLAAHPIAGMGGRLAALPIGGFGPSLLNPVRAAGTVGTTAAKIPSMGLGGALRTIPSNEAANLANVGLGTAIGTGMSVGPQLAQGRSLGEIATSPETLEGVIGGAIFNKPNKLGQNFFGFHPEVSVTDSRAAQKQSTAERAMEADIVNKAREEYMKKFIIPLSKKQQKNLANQPPQGPSRKLYEFQMAKQELAKQEAELANVQKDAAIAEVKQQTEQVKQATEAWKRQTRMALGAKAQPEAIMGRGVEPPKVDYSNYEPPVETIEQPKPVSGLQEEADVIQERLERRPQEADEGLYTEEQRLAQQRMQEEGLDPFPSAGARQRYAAKAATRGVDVTDNPSIAEKGVTLLPETREAATRIAAEINPEIATADTLAHEGTGHAFIRMLKDSPYKSDNDIVARYEQLVKESGTLDRINKARAKVGKKLWDIDEYMASQQGFESILRDPAIAKEGKWKEWFRDFKAQVKHILGNPTESDLRRLIDYKWHTDPAFERYFNAKSVAAVGGSKAVAQPFDEGFNTREGDDVWSNPQDDIEVNDALPAKLPPAPEGYRRVKVNKPDGGSYEAFFNDKYYDLGEMGKFASIAKYTKKGDLTHGATAKGETIEELPSQTYRRSQEADEGLDARYFMTSSERVLKSTVKGFQPAHQVLNTLRNKIPPGEWDMLKTAGIEEAFGPAQRVNAEEVTKWIDENGPRAEVKSYGAEGKVSEAAKELGRMQHEWYDKIDYRVKTSVDAAARALRGDPDKYTNADYQSWVNQAVDDGYESGVKRRDIERYIDLKVKAINDNVNDTTPKMTGQQVGAYERVSPFATKEPMPEWTTSKSGRNVQRVDVVIPQSSLKTQTVGEWLGRPRSPYMSVEEYNTQRSLWSPDSLHEQHPSTLGWAMIQYKTGPKGEKIAVIGEVQSRWGQSVREMRQAQKEAEQGNRRGFATAAEEKQMADKKDHPLLRDYNRLILKSAIEQARKEGATHIVVSDAETAMMTEGHDLQPKPKITEPIQDAIAKMEKAGYELIPKDDGKSWSVIPKGAKGIHVMIDARGNVEETMGIYERSKKYLKDAGVKHELLPQQEPGMRLNYDRILPKIAEELTGSKGERVSLGEHKNAFEKPNERQIRFHGQDYTVTNDPLQRRFRTEEEAYAALEEQKVAPRSNLIFRNPDGSPKTDVSGMMYALPERKQPFSYFERRSQAADEGLSPYKNTSIVGRTLLSKVASEVEKLRAQSPLAAQGAEQFYDKLRWYRGQLEQSLIRDIKAVRRPKTLKEFIYQDNPDYQKVVQYFDAAMDGDTLPKLTATQQKIAEALKKNLKQSLEFRESFTDMDDVQGLARETGANPNYLPHVMSRDAASILAESPTSPEGQKYLKDFIAYRTTKRNQTEAEALADWDTLRSMFTLQEGGDIASRFGAIDKAAGLGLPKSMREQHLLDRMSRFNRRYARRLAYHETIQRQPEVSDAFYNKRSGVGSSETGRNILEDIYGQREYNETTLEALSGVVRSLMLGPLTGAKDVVAGQFLGLQHMDLNQVLPAKAESLKNWSENYKKAYLTGVLRENIGGLETGEGGLKRIQQLLQRSRDVINTVQGRSLLENVSRTLNFGEGRYLALDAIHASNKSAMQEKFLKNFMPEYKAGTKVTDTMVDQAAARYVESVQGTYDYRGLPAITMKGSLAPVLSLNRWSIEKFNNFTKHVVEPAMNGDYKPLLMATIGMFVGGQAVNALVEQVTGRKERTPEWKEIAESDEQMQALAYKIAALSALSGYGGVLGDVAKGFFDARNKNRVQTWNNPLIDAVGTALEDTGFLLDAMQDGDLPAVTDILNMLAQDYVQAYRVMLPQISAEKQKEIEEGNKRRDLKVFKQNKGLPVTPSSKDRPNPLVRQDERQFKQTEDISEALTLLPELVDRAIEDSKDANGNVNPELLKSNISRLRRNSYQTVPSPEANPYLTSQYMEWLNQTQSPDAARARMEDYVRRNAINRAKSSLVPSL